MTEKKLNIRAEAVGEVLLICQREAKSLREKANHKLHQYYNTKEPKFLEAAARLLRNRKNFLFIQSKINEKIQKTITEKERG